MDISPHGRRSGSRCWWTGPTPGSIARAVKEPDGFPGWPKVNPNGHEDGLYGDSMLGEAMALGPVVMASAEILKTPALKRKWGTQARKYLDLSLRLFEKW